MPQTYLVYLALGAALASLLLSSWRIWNDRQFRSERLAFERTERAVRENYERNELQKRQTFEQNHLAEAAAQRARVQDQWLQFETAELENREAFASSERSLRIRFMAQHDRAQTEAEARIKEEVKSYVQLEKWREGAWERNLSRLEQASKALLGTTSGLVALVDEGPFYSDARMVQETARVLDVFGDFQSSVNHFAMPAEMAELSRELVGQVTKILLNLSPAEKVRRSEERKLLLNPLKAELKIKSDAFLRRCGDFERDPSAFLKG